MHFAIRPLDTLNRIAIALPLAFEAEVHMRIRSLAAAWHLPRVCDHGPLSAIKAQYETERGNREWHLFA